MLTLFEGGLASPMHKELTSAIAASVELGRRVYLIVPEQQTVNAECEMSELLPPSAPLLFEVTNFTRFINTAFRAMGGISREYATGAARSLIMWRALTELTPVLSMTRGRIGVSEGLVRKALSAVLEMQSLGITPEMLADAADADMNDRRLTEKLSDLSLIYSLFTDLYAKRFSDSSTDAAALAEMLSRDGSFLSGAEIYVDGFTSFTDGQYRILGALMRHASLTVTLTLGRGGESYEYSESAATRRRLIALADGAECDKRLKKFPTRDDECNPVIGEMAELLWRTDGYIDNDSLQKLAKGDGTIRIFKSETVFDECESVAADIKRRVMMGARYSDFAIVARATDGYVGILDAALADAGISHFFSRTKDVFSLPLFKMISIAYRIVSCGWRREDVITYLKSGLSGIGRDEQDRFELYCERWGIDGRRFTDGLIWNMSPQGYGRPKEGDAELILEIDRTRAKITEPLLAFGEAVSAAATVREQADALLAFLASVEAEELMARRAETLRELGEIEEAESTSRAFGILCDALDVLVEISSDLPSNPASFSAQLTLALGDATVGRIPRESDAVTVGSADMLRINGKKHIYLLGVNQGEFPGNVAESSYFAESERSRLMAIGLPIEPELEIKGARELFSFSRAFASATESVTIYYVDKTPIGSPLLPSDVIARIGVLTRGRVAPVRVSLLPKSDLIYTPERALEALGELEGSERSAVRAALLRSGFGERLEVAEGNIRNGVMSLTSDSLAILYKNDIYLSQTKIDKFLGCPMSYFCKYSLHLGEDDKAELGSNVIGSFVHSVIESFFGELEARGIDAAELTEADRNAITGRAAERYATELIGSSLSNARTRVAVSRLTRATRPVVDGLCDELSGCKYKPAFFELETDARNPDSPDHVVIPREGGGRIILRGTIDRVDTYRSGEDVYVRVVDYKTGYTDFLPSKLRDGEYLQMFLYLKAVADTKKQGFLDKLGVGEGGRVIPAGVVYVKTKVSDTTVRRASDEDASTAVKKLQERDGMLLDSQESISAMNSEFIPPEKKRSEPLRYTEEGWREIEATLTDVVKSVADEMTSGCVRATPSAKRARCEWCRYKPLCRSVMSLTDKSR